MSKADEKTALAVLVHGLGSDVRRFWGSTIDALETHPDLAHVQVRAWGYPTTSKPEPRFIQLAKKQRLQTIEQLGKQLWSELTHWFETNRYDTVLLLGHSMGGLVVAAAVDEGLRAGTETKLIEGLKGVAFCATPFGGARLAGRLRWVFRILGRNPQVEGLRENSSARKKLAVRFVNRTQTRTYGRHHRKIDLVLFRAADDHIVSEAEMLGPFDSLQVPVKVLRHGHSACIQDLGSDPDDPSFDMIVHWIRQRTAGSAPSLNGDALVPPIQISAREAAGEDGHTRVQIQVAKTNDGAHIAYWAMGSGVPLVIPPAGLPFSNVELELENPLTLEWYKRLAEFCQPIRYDARGSGKSEDPAAAMSLDGLVRDVEAVRRDLNVDKIALLGAFHGGPIALSYAAAFPEHVSHVVLWCAYAQGDEFWGSQEVRALNDVLATNWSNYTEVVAGTVFGWDDEATRRRMVLFLRHRMDPESVRQSLAAMERFDVRPLLSQIGAPTLVLHAGKFRFLSHRTATELAGEIHGAELATIEESEGLLLNGMHGAEEAAARIEGFLRTRHSGKPTPVATTVP